MKVNIRNLYRLKTKYHTEDEIADAVSILYYMFEERLWDGKRLSQWFQFEETDEWSMYTWSINYYRSLVGLPHVDMVDYPAEVEVNVDYLRSVSTKGGNQWYYALIPLYYACTGYLLECVAYLDSEDDWYEYDRGWMEQEVLLPLVQRYDTVGEVYDELVKYERGKYRPPCHFTLIKSMEK